MTKVLEVGERYLLACREWDAWLMGNAIPIYVKSEYSHCYICDVLPHRSKPFNFGVSTPYRITINKQKLAAENGGLCIYEY